MIVQAQNKFQSFRDLDGNPLDNGYIYIGTAGFNPETNAVQVYSDSAFTVPVAQPLRTLGGYIVINGSPINIYTNADYSITVRGGDGSLIYSSLSGNIDATQESALSALTSVISAETTALSNISYAETTGITNVQNAEAAALASIAAVGTFASGTWTPTVTNVDNASSITVHSDSNYLRVGNVVTCSMNFQFNPVSAGLVTIDITVPVATTFTGIAGADGAGSGGSSTITGYFQSYPTTNKIRFICTALDTSTTSIYGTFQYVVK